MLQAARVPAPRERGNTGDNKGGPTAASFRRHSCRKCKSLPKAFLFKNNKKKVQICLLGPKLVWLVDGPTASLRKQNIAEPDEAAGVC